MPSQTSRTVVCVVFTKKKNFTCAFSSQYFVFINSLSQTVQCPTLTELKPQVFKIDQTEETFSFLVIFY